MSAQNYSVLTDVRPWLARISCHYDGVPLDKSDAETFRSALGYQLALAYDILSPTQTDIFRSWISSTREIDVLQFGLFLGEVDSYIKNYLACYESNPALKMGYPSFKRSASNIKGYWGFIAPIKDLIESFLLMPTVPCFATILQWLNFIRRLNLRKLDLSSKMERDYVDFEHYLAQVEYDENTLLELNSILKEWFPPYRDFSDFRPKHGPGSIAGFKGRPPLAVKHQLVGVDARLAYLAKDIGDIDSYRYSRPLGSSRVSEIVCVPKSMITNRTISKEPCGLQYFQQGFMATIMEDTMMHPYLGRRISFVDQTLSAELARAGSIFGDYATIDLSNASDSVSLRLVKRVLRNTWLLKPALCTRSDATVLPSGQIVTLAKFAPMGSALCFPIETIIFAACCELSARRTGGRPNYRVFGDDIVISEDLVEELMIVLAACHFKVNATKSFWGTTLLNFREACGGEYFNGVEVTPLRISRKFKYTSRFTKSSADTVSSYIDFANQAFSRGYLTLRREILSHLKAHAVEYVWDGIPYSTTGDIGLTTFADSCTNFRLKERVNSDLLLKEVKGIVPKAIGSSTQCSNCTSFCDSIDFNTDQCEVIRYFEYLRRSQETYEEQRIVDGQLNICPVSVTLTGAWLESASLDPPYSLR